jgi:hypothetical protein
VTTGLSQEGHKGCPPTEDQKTEDQKTEDRDQKTDPQGEFAGVVVPIRENRCLAMEDKWAARKANRKGGAFEEAWEQYQRNCIVVDRSPGNKANASTAWNERFPSGPTPEFLESLTIYWQQQLEKFKTGQQCIGVVGMARFISEPEHAVQAITRQQLLAQAPQLANPQSAATAFKEAESKSQWAQYEAEARARLAANGGAA